MPKNQKTTYLYSSCFKEKVVQEVAAGSSISEVRRRYDIKGGQEHSGLDKKIWT
jgi:transposase-like protein